MIKCPAWMHLCIFFSCMRSVEHMQWVNGITWPDTGNLPCIWTQNRHILKHKSTKEQDPMHEDRHWCLPCNAPAESAEALARTREATAPSASSQRLPQPAPVAGRDCRKPGLWSGRPTMPAFRPGERRSRPIERVTAEPPAGCPRNYDHLYRKIH